MGNSALAGQHTDSVVYSIYPSPYININGDHWTKHYYIGPERVASSTGKLNAGFGSLYYPGNVVASPGPPDNVNYTAMRHVMEDSIASVYERLGVPYEPQRVGIRGEGGHLYIPITLDEENAGDISAETAETPDGSRQRSHPSTLVNGHVYYYHRDHLGSTQAVTDGAGDFTQFVEYTPWGEVFVELKGDSVLTTPYLFNGKELDEETGLYYYGARYYDPKMSVWYSTDHDQEKYPHVSSYCYTLSNPINAIDPNGNLVIFINGMNISSGGKAEYWKGLNYKIMNIVNDKHQRYYDGSSGGVLNTLSHGILTGNLKPYARFAEGIKMGRKDAEHIFNSLKEGETIKVFTHSMGAAYGKGFIIGLQTYAKSKNIDIKGIIDFEMDLAPYQSFMQSSVNGVKTVSIGHYWDGVAGPSLMPFVENHNTRFDKFTLNPIKEHSVNSFTQEELIQYMPDVHGITIKNVIIWEQNGRKDEE